MKYKKHFQKFALTPGAIVGVGPMKGEFPVVGELISFLWSKKREPKAMFSVDANRGEVVVVRNERSKKVAEAVVMTKFAPGHFHGSCKVLAVLSSVCGDVRLSHIVSPTGKKNAPPARWAAS